MIVTMTTVGYGDSFPYTLPGRAISFLLCIWGVFLVSLMVLILFEMLQLSEAEKTALKVYQKLEIQQELLDASSQVVQSVFFMIKEMRKKEGKSNQRIK